MDISLGSLKHKRVRLSGTDIVFALVTLGVLGMHLADALAGNFVATLFVLQQAAVLLFVLTHRPPVNEPVPYGDVLWAWAGTLLLLVVRPAEIGLRVPGGLVLLLGVTLSIFGVLSLGRSFSIEPALRGVQTHGLYRFVRHPLYASYLLIGAGYLIANVSVWNVAVLTLWMVAQVTRIRREEAVLRMDPDYVRYSQKVRWRLVPGLW